MKTPCLSAPVGACGRPHGSASLPVAAAELAANLEAATQAFVAVGEQPPGHWETEVLRQTQRRAARSAASGSPG